MLTVTTHRLVAHRTTTAQTDCSMLQCVDNDFGDPMKCPAHDGTEDDLAAATQCYQDDLHRSCAVNRMSGQVHIATRSIGNLRTTSALIATAAAIWTAVETTMRDAASLTATVTPDPE